jgi:acetyltransferase-like isoleucine patch superfamily enzyme
VERYYSDDELRHLGLGDVGHNVRLDRSTVLLNPAGLRIGDNTRIDAFCLISAFGPGVSVGRNVHIAAGAYIFGGGGVAIEDFAGISARSIIYSANDDYSGEYLTGPTIEPEFTAVRTAPVRVGRHAVVGAGSIILPGVTLGEGSASGALSLIKEDVDAFTIVAGSPARAVKTRSRRLLDRETEFLRREQGRGS